MTMRVLWFIPIPPRVALERKGDLATGTGFWIHSLIEELAKSGKISLAVAFVHAGPPEAFEHESVRYYAIQDPPGRRFAKLIGAEGSLVDQFLLRKAAALVEHEEPNLIHVHGTETAFGLLRSRRIVNVPSVVSIQGLMEPLSKLAWGDKSLLNVLAMQNLWELTRGLPLIKAKSALAIKGIREAEILRGQDSVIGRTSWDRSYTWSVAPGVPYYHVDELMRPEFWEAEWSLESCRRHSVYTSGRLTLLKGMHVFIEAMSLVRRDVPDLEVRIAGNLSQSGESRYLQKLVDKLGLADCIKFLNWIPGPQIVEELKRTHLYANSSFIENGCNALQEAMLVGLPCVTGFAGGMSTTLKHRKTGLMYPRGNAFMLADRIRELFANDDLAVSLGQAAREKALARHDRDTILENLFSAYEQTIKHD